jgi:hypothetical protein
MLVSMLLLMQQIENTPTQEVQYSRSWIAKDERRRRIDLPLVISKLDTSLLDYRSARFRNIKVVIGNSEWATAAWCGEFNSKNAFGAFTGWQPFAVDFYRLYSERVEIEERCNPIDFATRNSDESGALTYGAPAVGRKQNARTKRKR